MWSFHRTDVLGLFKCIPSIDAGRLGARCGLSDDRAGSGHGFVVIRRVMPVVAHTVLMLVTLVTMAGCQPRAAVSPAPPAPQEEASPAPVVANQSTRRTGKQPAAIPWPPPPPPLPAKPPADTAASVEDTAALSTTAPPAPKPMEDSAPKIEGVAAISKPLPSPILQPEGDAPPKIEGAETTSKSLPTAPLPPPEETAAQQKPHWENVRSAAAIPDQNTFYDEENPVYQTLQKANQALQGFPLIRKPGELDWGEALSSGLIQPRASLSGSGEMMVLDFDIVMKDTKSTPYVRFSHRTHTQWLECSNCHRQIFIPMINANPISMAAILEGKYCGVCHNTVAFPTTDCERCHNVPNDQ